jgi:maleylacetate reductase
MKFVFRSLPWNVVFGRGAIAELPERLASLKLERPLILSTPGRAPGAKSLARLLAPSPVDVFAAAKTHTPLAAVEDAEALARNIAADCTIAMGGGSTIGLGKALALRAGLPNVAVPTTYSGSEMTNIWGYSVGDKKEIGRADAVVPRLTIYDPELTLDLPAAFSGASGLNAIAQAVVNITVAEPNPLISLWALEAIRVLAPSLRTIAASPQDIGARETALYGACLAGAVIGMGATSLHHKLCHVFGGRFGTPHAQTHAVLLPYTVAFNAPAVPRGTQSVAEALGVADAARGLRGLGRALGVPASLAELGIAERDLDEAARLATRAPVNNPRDVTFEAVRDLLQNAFAGALAQNE